MGQLSNQVALLAGGGGGIGRAIAERFSAEGATLAIADVDAARAAGTLDIVQGQGGRGLAVPLDVTDAGSVAAAVQQVVAAYGRIDILLNCFGVYGLRTVAETSEAEWDRVLDINLKGVFRCCRAVYPLMREKGYGRIINFSSAHGFRGKPGAATYSAAKAGIVGFSRCLALEVADRGVTVNTIAPSMTDTDMPRGALSQADIELNARSNPMGRIATPADIAAAALYLASPDSSYVSGQVLHVNGGQLMP